MDKEHDMQIPIHYQRVIGTYYLIRHKESNTYMPQAKKNRGYTHWNPSKENTFTSDLGFPRLLRSRKQAEGCITQWATMPNAHHSYSISYEGHEDSSLDIKPDGRKREDLEVVEVQLVCR